MCDRIIRRLLAIVAIIIAFQACGCISLYRRHDVMVLVRDAQTQDAIEGAPIEVSYQGMLVLNAPEMDRAVTGPDGEARLRLAAFNPGVFWSIYANNYVVAFGDGGPPGSPRQKYLEGIGQPYMLVAPDAMTTIDLVRPTVVIVLPDEHLGLIRLSFDPSARYNPYRHSHEYKIEGRRNGYVPVGRPDVPPTLDWSQVTFRRYRNGYNEMTIDQPHSFLGSDDTRKMWYLGSPAEAQRLYDYIHPVQSTDASTAAQFDATRFGEVWDRGEAALGER